MIYLPDWEDTKTSKSGWNSSNFIWIVLALIVSAALVFLPTSLPTEPPPKEKTLGDLFRECFGYIGTLGETPPEGWVDLTPAQVDSCIDGLSPIK